MKLLPSFFHTRFYTCALATVMACTMSHAQQLLVPESKASDDSNTVDIAGLVAFMQPNTPVLTVGDMKIIWADFAPVFRKASQGRGNAPASADEIKSELRKRLQTFAKRGLLLQEANAMKIHVTSEDVKRYEADLENSLKGNEQGITKEQFINSFNRSGSTMMQLSYEDALKLAKLDKIKFSNLTIPNDHLEAVIQYGTGISNVIKEKNDIRHKACINIAADKNAKTDKGFAELAKEYSEGTEGKWGGEIKYDFTRKELAKVCNMKEFNFKVGETTPLCETPTAYRVVRVLRAVPQKNGKEPKLRIAQILVGKLEVPEINREEVRKKMLVELKKQKIDEFARLLTSKYPVKTLFFPKGLWE